MAFRDEMKRFADKSSAEQEKVQNEVLIRFNNLLHDRDQLKIKLDDVIETNDILNQSVTVLADSLSTDATQIENNSPSKSSNTVSFSSQTDFSVPRNEQALDQMCAILDGFPSRLSDEELLMVASLSRIQGEVDVRASQPVSSQTSDVLVVPPGDAVQYLKILGESNGASLNEYKAVFQTIY